MTHSRRKFIQQASAALAGTGLAAAIPTAAFAEKSRNISANEKINYGVIGCKGMGWSNMKAAFNMPEVECIALADVDQSVLDERAQDVENIRGKRPKLFKDYRKMLELKDLDAVIIGTPDHWHCRIYCDALAAGKHVYVEKPIANTIEECNIMLKAAKRYGKMVQVGQWQRSGTHYAQAHEYLKSGKLGNIRLVKVWAYQGWMNPVDKVPDSDPPPGVDYAMWLGPAPKRPFNKNRFHFNFRWFWDYAGGLMTDWGVHEIDIALFFMNAKAPKSVMASGGKLAYPNDASETPDTLQTVFEYDNFNMLWEHATGIDGGNYGKTEGIAFIGNNGTLVVNRGGWELIPETKRNDDGLKVNKIEALPYQSRGGTDYLQLHHQNFLEAIQKNDASILKCGIETGAIAAINAQMGNIAYKTGRKVYWDAAKGEFKNDKEASADEGEVSEWVEVARGLSWEKIIVMKAFLFSALLLSCLFNFSCNKDEMKLTGHWHLQKRAISEDSQDKFLKDLIGPDYHAILDYNADGGFWNHRVEGLDGISLYFDTGEKMIHLGGECFYRKMSYRVEKDSLFLKDTANQVTYAGIRCKGTCCNKQEEFFGYVRVNIELPVLNDTSISVPNDLQRASEGKIFIGKPKEVYHGQIPVDRIVLAHKFATQKDISLWLEHRKVMVPPNLRKSFQVSIYADKDAAMDYVGTVLEELGQCGIAEVNLAVRTESDLSTEFIFRFIKVSTNYQFQDEDFRSDFIFPDENTLRVKDWLQQNL